MGGGGGGGGGRGYDLKPNKQVYTYRKNPLVHT